MLLTHILFGVIASSLPLTSAQQTGQACNNYAALCSRSYSNITQLGAHNSPFLRDGLQGLMQSGNHYYNSTVQLDYGVRLLTAQVHQYNNTLRLCHSSCSLLDAGLLRDWLTSIHDWLISNPSNVVTLLLVNADSVSASSLATEFTAASLPNLSYVPPSTPPPTWPTLSELISNSTPLITFVDTLEPDPTIPYLLPQYSYVFETPYRNLAPTDLDRCGVDRPSSYGGNTPAALSAGLLPLVNHFLYDNNSITFFGQGVEQPDEGYANVTNAPRGPGVGNLGDKVGKCTAEYGRGPWAVLVDFFNVGPALGAVDAANGVGTGAVGRRRLDPGDEGVAATSAGSRRRAGDRSWWAVAAMVVVLGI